MVDLHKNAILLAMSTAPYQRAAWIPDEPLWPRETLANAGLWTPCENREFQAAFDAQHRAIARALELESLSAREERLQCKTGLCAPNPADHVFDMYFEIAKVQGVMLKNEGIVMGLQASRGCNDAMLAEASQNVVKLEIIYAQLVEDFAMEYPEHFARHSMHVCIKKTTPPPAGDVQSCGKRVRTTGEESPDIIATETPEYWLLGDNLSLGLRISNEHA